MCPKRRSKFAPKPAEAARKRHEREQETPSADRARLDAVTRAAVRAVEPPQVTRIRQAANAARQAASRAAESPEASQERQAADAARHAATASKVWRVFHGAAFQYDPTIQYQAHAKIKIGDMTAECLKCSALKWQW